MNQKHLLYAETTANVGDLALRRQLHAWLYDHGVTAVEQFEWSFSEGAVEPFPQLSAPARSIKHNPFGALVSAVGCRLVIGPGQMLRDTPSVASLLALYGLALTARATGGDVRFLAVGVGRLERPAQRWLWRAICALSSHVWLRDAKSFARAADHLGGREKMGLMSDLLFLDGPVRRALALPGGAEAIVVAPARDLGERRVVDVAAMAGLAITLARKLKVGRVVLIAHDNRPDGDLNYVLECCDLITADAPDIDCEVVSSPSIDDVVGYYRNARAVVTNRLHGMIFGVLAGKPVLVLEDGSGKLTEFATTFDLPRCDLAAYEIAPEVVDQLRDLDPKTYAVPADELAKLAADGIARCFETRASA